MARERALSGAGAALVAATTREEIYAAARESAHALLDEPAERRPPRARRGACPATRRSSSSSRPRARRARCCVVEPSPSRAVRGALQVARAQASLALDSAALTEEVHRRARRGALQLAGAALQRPDHGLDSDATVIYQSPSIEHVLGYTPEESSAPASTGCCSAGEEGRLLHLLADGARVAERRHRVARVRAAPPRRQRPPLRGPAHEPAATTSACAASCSTAATSASARRSRSSSPTRRSTTRSPASPTARCSPSASATPSPARAASTTAWR